MRHRELHLPNGNVAMVSEEDWERVSMLTWSQTEHGYVRGFYGVKKGGDGRCVKLHRWIMSAPAGMVVDHIDGNPLNNTRENLQITTQSRNLMRSPSKRGGVTRQGSRWRARLSVDGKSVSLGLYDTEKDAREVVESYRARVWADAAINVTGAIL
jgi:hypothetical protein